MKANGAPEKIYLDPKKVEESEFGIIDAIVPEYRVEKGDIEYTRTDAFIDKACEWLNDNARNYYSAYATEDRLIADFKKYMEE